VSDKAEAFRYTLIQAKVSPKYIRMAEEIKLRAERRAGGLLKEQVRKFGETDRRLLSEATITKLKPTLKEMKITTGQSSNWQRIASIPEDIWVYGLQEHQESGHIVVIYRL